MSLGGGRGPNHGANVNQMAQYNDDNYEDEPSEAITAKICDYIIEKDLYLKKSRELLEAIEEVPERLRQVFESEN